MDTDLRIDGEMTIYRAVELKASLLAEPQPLRLDLGGVSEIDTTGLQLLLAAQAAAARRGASLQIVQASTELRTLLDLLHLGHTLGLFDPADLAPALPAA